MFNFGDIMGGGMSKAASLRKPQGPQGPPNVGGMAGNIASGMSSMFPRPDMGGQTYSPPSTQQVPQQANPMINFPSPMEGRGMMERGGVTGGSGPGGFMERFRQMVPGGGITGGMGMQSPGIQDYKQKMMGGGGFNFPMMGF